MKIPDSHEEMNDLTGRWVIVTNFSEAVHNRVLSPNAFNVEWRKPWTTGVIAGKTRGDLIMVQQPGGCPALYAAEELTLLENFHPSPIDISKDEWFPVGDGTYATTNRMIRLDANLYARLYHLDTEGKHEDMDFKKPETIVALGVLL
jgi:hypothetical protein